jgi:hypothetical protein
VESPRCSDDFLSFDFFLWFLSFVLPDGVIGNTWAFGAHIPGSSPGRVVMAKTVAINQTAGGSTRVNTQTAKVQVLCGKESFVRSQTLKTLIVPLDLKEGSNVSVGTVVPPEIDNKFGCEG